MTVEAGNALPPRSQLCRSLVTMLVPDAISHFCVNKYFSSGELGRKAAFLVGLIGDELQRRVAMHEWLDEATRSNALLKLKLLAKNVISDGLWDSYGDLIMPQLGPSSPPRNNFYVASVVEAVAEHITNRALAGLGQPVQRSSFQSRVLFAPTSFYQPQVNAINLLPSLMQPPFFDPSWPAVANLAQWGAVIGHEHVHVLDTTGSMFNGTGALQNWWTGSSRAAFEERTRCLVEQDSAYSVATNQGEEYVNGNQTIGESQADLGGVRLAFLAYQQARLAEAKSAGSGSTGAFGKWSNGRRVTEDQFFFVRYAQVWCASPEPSAMHAYLRTNVHNPPSLRIKSPLMNNEQFAHAFGCDASSTYGVSLRNGGASKCEVW